MFVNLIVMDAKHIPQAVAGEDMKRGTPIENGEYIASVPKKYEGLAAVIDPKYVDSDEIKSGDIYNRVPTFKGERYATSELTASGLAKGDKVGVSDGKFVKNTAGNWKYDGEYANPFGVAMYIVEKIADYAE